MASLSGPTGAPRGMPFAVGQQDQTSRKNFSEKKVVTTPGHARGPGSMWKTSRPEFGYASSLHSHRVPQIALELCVRLHMKTAHDAPLTPRRLSANRRLAAEMQTLMLKVQLHPP